MRIINFIILLLSNLQEKKCAPKTTCLNWLLQSKPNDTFPDIFDELYKVYFIIEMSQIKPSMNNFLHSYFFKQMPPINCYATKVKIVQEQKGKLQIKNSYI